MAIDRERLKWADSALTGFALGRTGVGAKADIPLRARNSPPETMILARALIFPPV
jgi:hypothetical protein